MTPSHIAAKVCQQIADSIRSTPPLAQTWDSMEVKKRTDLIAKWETAIEKELKKSLDP